MAGTTQAAAVSEQLLARIVERLAECYHPLRIYLFGSAARGEAGPDSDLDILVVLPDDAPAELRQPGYAQGALANVDAPVSVLPWSWSGFNGRLHLESSLPSTVLREGRLLYAK